MIISGVIPVGNHFLESSNGVYFAEVDDQSEAQNGGVAGSDKLYLNLHGALILIIAKSSSNPVLIKSRE